MIVELSQAQFEQSADGAMTLLDEGDDRCNHLPLSEAIEQVIGQLEMGVEVEDFELHYIYQNEQQDFCHVGFNWGWPAVYLVLVVQPKATIITGYTILDFSKLK